MLFAIFGHTKWQRASNRIGTRTSPPTDNCRAAAMLSQRSIPPRLLALFTERLPRLPSVPPFPVPDPHPEWLSEFYMGLTARIASACNF